MGEDAEGRKGPDWGVLIAVLVGLALVVGYVIVQSVD
jgi:hypothetical protein